MSHLESVQIISNLEKHGKWLVLTLGSRKMNYIFDLYPIGKSGAETLKFPGHIKY